jgi:SSS family solute:Na+ symporter
LLAGWFTGMALGSALAYHEGLKPVYTFIVNGTHVGIYIGLLALAANFIVAIVATPVAARFARGSRASRMQESDFEDALPG